MPLSPSRLEVHINRPLTNISTAYIQNEKYFIHDKVFKTVPVQKQSDLYFKYMKDYWFRTGAMLRSAGSESAGGGFRFQTGQYLARKWAYHVDVDDDTRQNVDEPLDYDRDATNNVMRNLLLRREKLWQATFLAPQIWTGLSQTSGGTTTAYDFNPSVGTSGGAAGSGGTASQFGYGNGFWSLSTSNPIVDVTNLKLAGMSQTGEEANTLVVTADVDAALKNNPLIVERIKFGGTPGNPALMNEASIAQVLGVENYYVAKAVYNSAQEGQAGVYNFMSSNSALLTYVPPTAGLMTPAPGYIFAWTGLYGAGAYGSRIKKFRMEQLESDRIEGTMAFDMNMIGPDLGIYMTHLLR
jgi:hypothetical protein